MWLECIGVVSGCCCKEVQYAAKNPLPCTVRFTPDRLSKTEVKRILNGPQTGAERTVHGPFRFMYGAHTYVRIN